MFQPKKRERERMMWTTRARSKNILILHNCSEPSCPPVRFECDSFLPSLLHLFFFIIKYSYSHRSGWVLKSNFIAIDFWSSLTYLLLRCLPHRRMEGRTPHPHPPAPLPRLPLLPLPRRHRFRPSLLFSFRRFFPVKSRAERVKKKKKVSYW